MLKLYKNTTDPFTIWVIEKLEEMVVAHELIDVENSSSIPNGISQEDLPVLSDGHEKWTSEAEIKDFLEKLNQDLTFSRSLTSDACYVDPDNPDQCL